MFLTFAGSVARHPLTISIMDWQNITFLTVHQTLHVFLQGYRTGYPYRCPALRDKGKKYSDVENAPSAHGGYSYGDDSDSGARSPLKHSFQRGQRDKTRWVNSSGRPDEPCEDGPDGSSPKSKPKVWTNITHDHVKPLLQSLSSGVCVPSCITNCLVCAYLTVHSTILQLPSWWTRVGGRHPEHLGSVRTWTGEALFLSDNLVLFFLASFKSDSEA